MRIESEASGPLPDIQGLLSLTAAPSPSTEAIAHHHVVNTFLEVRLSGFTFWLPCFPAVDFGQLFDLSGSESPSAEQCPQRSLSQSLAVKTKGNETIQVKVVTTGPG